MPEHGHKLAGGDVQLRAVEGAEVPEGEALAEGCPDQLLLMSIMHNIKSMSPSAQIITVYKLLLVLPRRRFLLAGILCIPRAGKVRYFR